MKKILLILLAFTSFASLAQAEFPEGVQITGGQPTNTTPPFITTSAINGVLEKIPSAYIEKTANKTSVISGYSETLYPNEKAVHDGLDLKLNISDLPTNLTLYPTTAVSDVAGYVKMVTDIHDVDYNTVAVDVSTPLITTTNQLISQRISAPGVLIGQPGVFNITTFGNIRHLSGSGTASFYFEVYQRTAAGVETLICTSSNSLPVTNGGYSEFSASGVWDDGTFLSTDRIVIKSYANRIAGGSDPIYQFQFGGVSPVRTILPVPFSVVDAGYEVKINKQNSLAFDGTGIKYPTVDAINAVLPVTYSKIVYVNATSPTTATIFDLNNPPVTNDNLLKTDVNNLYIGTDASTWVYKTSPAGYVTKTVTSQTSNFNIEGTSIDAGNSKTASISRLGSISATSIKRIGGLSTEYLKADGSTTVLTNPITGTGTSNTIPKFTGTNTIGDGSIRDNVNVSIGTGGFSNKLTLYSAANEYALRVGQNTSNITNSFTGVTFYNSTNTGGTGTATGTASLKITRTAANLQGNLAFLLGATQIGMFDDYGHLLIATPTSNGVDALQTPLTISHAAGTTANQGVIKSQLDLKADLLSPTFTGVPSVPTATTGTNTTQIASTAFVTSAIPTNLMTLNTAQTFTATKSFVVTTLATPALNISNPLAGSTSSSLTITSSGGGNGLRSEDTGGGNAIQALTTTGNALYASTSGGGVAIRTLITDGTGNFAANNSTNASYFSLLNSTGISFASQGDNGTGFKSTSGGTTTHIRLENNTVATGKPFSYLKNNVEIVNINDAGTLTVPKITMTGTIELKSYTVATLPTGVEGATAYVTDAIAPIYLGALTGGGTVVTPVFYDGTVWRSTINSDSVSLTGNQTIGGIKTFTGPLIVSNLGGGPSRIVSADVNGELSASSVFTHDGQISVTNSITANSFIKTGGTASQFLKADGSVDESDVIKSIAKDATQGANVTGTVSETILYSKLIPANTFKDGDFMNLFSRVGKSLQLGTLQHRVKLNTSNTLTGATLIATNFAIETNRNFTMSRTFTVSNGFLTGFPGTTNASSDVINNINPPQFNVFDPTVDNYIFITGQISNASDTMYHLGTKITN